jgi:hypothetical protein
MSADYSLRVEALRSIATTWPMNRKFSGVIRRLSFATE